MKVGEFLSQIMALGPDAENREVRIIVGGGNYYRGLTFTVDEDTEIVESGDQIIITINQLPD